MTSIERGTRWMMFERNAQPTWNMARAQVEAFLDSLYAEGAFTGRSGEPSYFVVCDERVNNEETMRAGKINLAFGFAATKPGEYHAFNRDPGVTVVVTDPLAAHHELLDRYTDADMHNLTAYLARLK